MPLSGIDLSTMTTVRPQDDLYRHVNGTLAHGDRHPGRPAVGGHLHGAARRLGDGRAGHHRGRRRSTPTRPVSNGKIGELYNSFMDEAERSRPRASDPIRPSWPRSSNLRPWPTCARSGRLQPKRRGFSAGLLCPAPDAGNPDRLLLYTGQGGLGLPDESYYREEKFASDREAYRELRPEHAGTGRRIGSGAGRRGRVVTWNTTLASDHWDKVTLPRPAEDLQPEDPPMRWRPLFPLDAGLAGDAGAGIGPRNAPTWWSARRTSCAAGRAAGQRAAGRPGRSGCGSGCSRRRHPTFTTKRS